MLSRLFAHNVTPHPRGRTLRYFPPPRGVTTRRTFGGCDGAIEIDVANRSVTKTYLHPDQKTAARNALREVDYASRFYDALADVEGVACPRIIGWQLSTPPRVVMDWCPGKELPEILLGAGGHDARIAEISGKIQAGLEAYTRLFGEPYYDCCFNNMLFDENSGTLTFLDFVIPEVWPADEGAATPLEASLGWLVGCACYSLARPAFLFSSTSAHMALLRSVLAGFGGRANPDRVYDQARSAFSRMYESSGPVRWAYYRTVGKLVTAYYLGRLRRGRALNRSADTALRRD